MSWMVGQFRWQFPRLNGSYCNLLPSHRQVTNLAGMKECSLTSDALRTTFRNTDRIDIFMSNKPGSMRSKERNFRILHLARRTHLSLYTYTHDFRSARR